VSKLPQFDVERFNKAFPRYKFPRVYSGQIGNYMSERTPLFF
jgi:hypothetical protein